MSWYLFKVYSCVVLGSLAVSTIYSFLWMAHFYAENAGKMPTY